MPGHRLKYESGTLTDIESWHMQSLENLEPVIRAAAADVFRHAIKNIVLTFANEDNLEAEPLTIRLTSLELSAAGDAVTYTLNIRDLLADLLDDRRPSNLKRLSILRDAFRNLANEVDSALIAGAK